MEPNSGVKNRLLEILNGADFTRNNGSLRLTSLGGGSINSCFRVAGDSGAQWFCKLNSAQAFPGLFEKEKQGLDFLRSQGIIRIPETIACGEAEGQQFLLLEWIEPGPPTEAFWRSFGESMAHLHRVSHHSFGYEIHNYMGALPQQNTYTDNWPEFFIRQRLEPQLKLAFDKGLIETGVLRQSVLRKFEGLYKALPSIFPDEPPALLHGDCWSGNFLCDGTSNAVLIDPAVYFGNRGMDLAMTKLFGGFAPAFYEAYHHHYPLPAGYREQWAVCNLYPLLIHLNLFGKSYLGDILHTIERF